MKKLFYAIAALAVVASCAKVAEVETNVEPKEENNLVHMTIRAQAPETKTFIDQTGAKTYQPGWNLGDQLAVFFDAVNDNIDAVLDNYGDTGKAAEFRGNVTIENGDHTVYAFYPKTAVFEKGSTDKKVELQVASIQRPLANTFDPDADIAVGKALDINVASKTVVIDNMVFARPLSTVKVTVTNSNAGVDNSEKINAVVISAEGSNLTGTLSWDFESNEAAVATGNSSVTAMLTANPLDFGTSFFLLVNPTTVKASDTKPLTITIYTDAHKITKTITSLAKDLVFPLAGIAELRISTSGATVEESYVATLVKKPETISAGDEIVIAAADYNVLMSTEQKTNNRGQVETSKYDNDIIFVDNDAIQRFAVEPGTKASTFAFKGINGEKADSYIYAASSSKNYLKSTETKDDNASFTVSIDKNGVATIKAQGTNTRNILRYNSSDGLFSCYESGQKGVSIYKYKAGVYVPSLDTPANLEAVAVDDNIMVDWDDVVGADSYTVTCGETVQTGITKSEYTFEHLADGEYTVTVKAISNDHSTKLDSGVASTTVTVSTTPSYDFTTIAELNALITSETAKEYTGKLTSAIVSFTPDTKNAIIKDASASILYYLNAGHGLKQGQVFSGDLTVSAKLYNGASEITACDATFTGEETEVAPAVMTLEQLVGNFETYQNAYVSVSDLLVTSVSEKTVYVENGGKAYVVYSNAGNATVEANDIITAVGTVAQYKSNDQIKVWNMTDIKKTGEYAAPKHAVTFTQPSETGCSFTVSVGGETISSGYLVEENATVTLTATAGTGYKFTSWTVTGATVSGNTATATFVMGESDVTVSAAFEAVGNLKTYQHVFTAKPAVGNNTTLSGVDWNIAASELNGYNSGNYAGVQIGTSKKDGSLTLTSSSDWSYNGATKITEVRLWLNLGGTSVTPTVTINGKDATSDGTVVVKNSSAGSDWTKATKVTFTPAADGDTGVVVINIETVKAGYICAMEIDCK